MNSGTGTSAAQAAVTHAPGTRRHKTLPPAVVLGPGITALGAIRALGMAGIRAYQMGGEPGCERWSRWCRKLPGRKPGVLRPDDLADALDALPFSQAVLMPCADSWSAAVADLPQDVKRRFPCCQPTGDTLSSLVNKKNLARLLVTHRVPHPTTYMIESAEDLAICDDSAFESAFLKPHDSQRFFAKYGVKAFRVRSRAEASNLVANLRREGHEVVLQEYIPGPPSNHYFVDGMVDRHGIPCALFARRRLRMYPLDFGNSSYLVTVAPSEVEGCTQVVLKLFETIGFRGLFSAEFKLDERDRTFKLLEINARPWWYLWFAELCGLPMARMAYLDALDEPVERADSYRAGVCLVYPYYDYNACHALRTAGQLSIRAWASSWLVARQAIFTWRDPAPSVLGFCCHAAEYVSHRAAKLNRRSKATGSSSY